MLKDKFLITVINKKNSKQFYLSRWLKNVILIVFFFIIILFIIGLVQIYHLGNKLSNFNLEKQILLDEKQEIQDILKQKEEQFFFIEDKIMALEEQLGILSDNNLSLDNRAVNLKLQGEQIINFLSQIPNGYPVENQGISDYFGIRNHPVLNKQKKHLGLDFLANTNTPVYATANGVVDYVGFNSNGYGYMVIIAHNFGFKSVYAHLSKKSLNVIKIGEVISKGQLIAYSGNSGLSTGPHLHYEIRFVNKALDPLNFVKLEQNNIKDFFEKEKKVPWVDIIKFLQPQKNETKNAS